MHGIDESREEDVINFLEREGESSQPYQSVVGKYKNRTETLGLKRLVNGRARCDGNRVGSGAQELEHTFAVQEQWPAMPSGNGRPY